MATYEKKSWETINLPAVSGDTFFRILDHSVSTSPSLETSGIIYDGLILDGFGIQNLNEILSQYVNPAPITFTSSVQLDNNSYSKFYIYYTQDNWNNWTNDIIIITYDWSYTFDSRAVLSSPINNIIDKRQFFIYTIKATTPDVSQNILVKLDNNTIDSFTVSGYTYYNYIQNMSLLTYDNSDIHKLTIGPSTFSIYNTCYKYCLYYLNQFGGWDSLLFRGKELKTDNLSRLSYKKNYVANSIDFHKVDYLTTINERWSLNTSFLNDIESSKMINLMASNKLYIQDLETSFIAPVNITNSNCEHKNYKNQGRKMSTYTIEVSASQPKYRV